MYKEALKVRQNPSKFKEMQELAKGMTPEDLKRFQLFQEGLMGKVPKDDKWVDAVVLTLKNKSAMLKDMFTKQTGTPTSADQVATYIDWLASFDEKWLRGMLKIILSLVDMYTEVDKKIYGCGKYLLMVLGMILAYLIFRVLSFVARLVWVALVALYKTLVPATATATVSASASAGASAGASNGAGAGAGAGGASFFSGSASSASAAVPTPLSPTVSANLASSAASAAASVAASAAAAAAASDGQNRGGAIDGLKEKMGGFFSSLGGSKSGAGNKKPHQAASGSSSKQSDAMDSEF